MSRHIGATAITLTVVAACLWLIAATMTPARADGNVTYKVHAGDTPASVAAFLRMPLLDLLSQVGGTLMPDQEIEVAPPGPPENVFPSQYIAFYTVTRADVKPNQTLLNVCRVLNPTLQREEDKVTIDDLANFNDLPRRYHLTQAGDTIAGLATRYEASLKPLADFYQMTPQALLRIWNELDDTREPVEGRLLIVGWQEPEAGDRLAYPLVSKIVQSVEDDLDREGLLEKDAHGNTKSATFFNPKMTYELYAVKDRAIAPAPAGAMRVNGVTTITTTEPHGLNEGDYVLIGGVTDPTFNGPSRVATVPNATSFTCAQKGAPATGGGGSAIDTLGSIANAYGGKVSADDLRKANDLPADQPLVAGQVLFVPTAASAFAGAVRIYKASAKGGAVLRSGPFIQAFGRAVPQGETLYIYERPYRYDTNWRAVMVDSDTRPWGWIQQAQVQFDEPKRLFYSLERMAPKNPDPLPDAPVAQAMQVRTMLVPGVEGVVSPRKRRAIELGFVFASARTPYHMGGGGMRSIDCSNLVHYCFTRAGVPGASRLWPPCTNQIKYGQHVGSLANPLRAGDRVFFDAARLGYGVTDHTAIYIGGGKIVEATPSYARVSNLSKYRRIFFAARRDPD